MYTVALAQFEGPLALLLEFIENAELDITTVSLGAVANQFLAYVDTHEVNDEELADFLVIAAKLLVIKSHALFPAIPIPDEPGMALETQLTVYRAYYEHAKHLDHMIRTKAWAYPRKGSEPMRGFVPPPTLTAIMLREAWIRLLGILERARTLPTVAIQRSVTLAQRIRDLHALIVSRAQLSFREWSTHGASKADVIVNFLALLELTKRNIVRVTQRGLFQDITITRHEDAPPLRHA